MRRLNIFIPVLLLVFTSCSGFLEEVNPTGLDNIYSTEYQLESDTEAVMAAFLYGHGLAGESTEAFGIASGLLHWGQTSQRCDSDKFLSCLKFTQYTKNDWNGYNFRSMFMVVFRANALIAALQSAPVSAQLKLELEAEARFYRAVAYFIAVRKWGDLPVWTEEVNAGNASNKVREPYYKVYEQIIKDLKFAADNMRSPERVDQVGANIVRPNKYAATAYLSSVYTTIGSLLEAKDDNFWDPSKPGRAPDFTSVGVTDAKSAYAEALRLSELLIPESTTYDNNCKYRLLEQFSDLFTYNYSFSRSGYTSFNHPEQVFVIPVSAQSDASCVYAQYQLPQYPAGTSCTSLNEQYGRLRPTRWLFQKWCETYPGEWRNSNHFEYKSCTDPRFDDTFFYSYMEYCCGMKWGSSGLGYISMYPSDMSYNLRQNAFPYFKKYASASYNSTSGDADIYAMRFAEVYFNAIEAAAYLGNETLARKYMEVIHGRARASRPGSVNPTWNGVTFDSKDELMTRIFWEREFEFAGEDHEYYETHRHGAKWLVENIAKPKNDFITRNINNYTSKGSNCWNVFMTNFYPSETWRYSEDVDEARCGLVCGCPIDEILYNSGIDNNGKNDFEFSDLK